MKYAVFVLAAIAVGLVIAELKREHQVKKANYAIYNSVCIKNDEFFKMLNSGPNLCAEASPIKENHRCSNNGWLFVR